MKALLLAAGYGKRLQPITNTIPKSMVRVNNTPLLINALNVETEAMTCKRAAFLTVRLVRNWKIITGNFCE